MHRFVRAGAPPPDTGADGAAPPAVPIGMSPAAPGDGVRRGAAPAQHRAPSPPIGVACTPQARRSGGACTLSPRSIPVPQIQSGGSRTGSQPAASSVQHRQADRAAAISRRDAQGCPPEALLTILARLGNYDRGRASLVTWSAVWFRSRAQEMFARLKFGLSGPSDTYKLVHVVWRVAPQGAGNAISGAAALDSVFEAVPKNQAASLPRSDRGPAASDRAGDLVRSQARGHLGHIRTRRIQPARPLGWSSWSRFWAAPRCGEPSRT